MIPAKEKKKQSAAQYVLYMWQLEDLIRALNFDFQKIKKSFVDNTNNSEAEKEELTQWFQSLVDSMIADNVKATGHCQMVKNVVDELNDLHLQLLRSPVHIKYNTQFYSVLPLLAELRPKSNCGQEVNDIELCLTAVYGVLLLGLQQKEVTEQTSKAVGQIMQFLEELSALYKQDEEGILKL